LPGQGRHGGGEDLPAALAGALGKFADGAGCVHGATELLQEPLEVNFLQEVD